MAAAGCRQSCITGRMESLGFSLNGLLNGFDGKLSWSKWVRFPDAHSIQRCMISTVLLSVA
jgi:hypothetical protein